MRNLLLIAAALAFITTPAFAEVGAIQVPRHDRMVCDKIEDVRPANDAWLQLINKGKSIGLSPESVENEIAHGEMSKWLGPCGIIKTGKAALVREEKRVDGVNYTCVEIFANVPSAQHYANVVGKCHWSPEFSNAYTNEDGPAELAPANVRNQQQTSKDKLYEGYWRFALVQYCHKVREGYAVIFVSDPEFERSETIAKAIEKKAIAEDGSLETNKIWRQAVDHNNGLPVSRNWCQRAYRELLELVQWLPSTWRSRAAKVQRQRAGRSARQRALPHHNSFHGESK